MPKNARSRRNKRGVFGWLVMENNISTGGGGGPWSKEPISDIEALK